MPSVQPSDPPPFAVPAARARCPPSALPDLREGERGEAVFVCEGARGRGKRLEWREGGKGGGRGREGSADVTA